MVSIEPVSFGSVAGALPTELLGNISTVEYFINIKIENMLYGHFSSCRVINIVIEYATLLFSRYKSKPVSN